MQKPFDGRASPIRGFSSLGMTTPNGDGILVSKLLTKLKESQDLFDNLETLFDTKVKELGSTEGDLQKAASQITSLHRIIEQTGPKQLDNALTSPSNTAPTEVEISILHEKIRQLQLEHEGQLRAQVEGIDREISHRVQEDVIARMSSHNKVVEQVKLEAKEQRDTDHQRIQEYVSEIERLREAVLRQDDEYRQEIISRERDLVSQSEERLQEQIHIKNHQVGEARIDVERFRAELEEKQLEILRKDTSITIANETIADMRDQHARAVEAIDELNNKHQSVATEAQRIGSSLGIVTTARNELENEYSVLQSTFEQRSIELRESREEAEKYKSIAEKLRDDHIELRRQVSDVQSVNELRIAEVQQLKISSSTLQVQLDDQITRTERQLKQKERDLENQLEEKRKPIETELKAKSDELLSLKRKVNELSQYQEIAEQGSHQIQMLTQKGSDLEFKLQDKGRELQSATEKCKQVEDLTIKLNASEMREMMTEEKLRESQVLSIEKEREIAVISAKLRSAEELKAQLQNSEVNRSTFQERERDAVERLRHKEVEVNALNEKMRHMDEIKIKLREELAGLRAQNDTLKDRVEHGRERDSELSACKDEMTKAALELSRRNDEISSLKQQSYEVQTLRVEVGKLSEVKILLEQRNNKVDELTKEITTSKLECQRKDREYEALVSDYDAKEEESIRQSATIEAAEEELRELVRTRSELEISQLKLEELQRLFESRESNLQEKADELTSGCELMIEGQEKLKEECTTIQEQLREATAKNEHLEALLKHKEFMVGEKDKEISSSDAKLVELRSWMHDKVKQSTDEVSEARSERDESLRQLSDMRISVSRKEQESDHLRQQNSELRQMVERRELETTSKTSESDVLSLRNEITHLKETNTTIQKQLRTAEETRIECEEKVVHIGMELSSERKRTSTMQNTITELNDKLLNLPVAPPSVNRESQKQEQSRIDDLQEKFDELFTQFTNTKSIVQHKTQECEQHIIRERQYAVVIREAQEVERLLRMQISEMEKTEPMPAPLPDSISRVNTIIGKTSASITPMVSVAQATISQEVMPSVSATSVAASQLNMTSLLHKSDTALLSLPLPIVSSSVEHSQPLTEDLRTSSSVFVPVAQHVSNVSALFDPMAPVSAPVSLSHMPEQQQSMASVAAPVTDLNISVSQAATPLASTPSEIKPVLGLQLDPKDVKENSLKVAAVKVGGPAYKAGIRKGDYLVSIDKFKIDTEGSYEKALAKYQPGSEVELKFVRHKAGGSTNFDSVVKLQPSRSEAKVGRRNSIGSGVGRKGTRSQASSAASTPSNTSLTAYGSALSLSKVNWQ